MILKTGVAKDPSLAGYLELRERGAAAAREGLWNEALAPLASAWEWAELNGDEELKDRAFCNLSAVRIELREEIDECLGQLRKILLRSRDPEGRWLASYNIARAYEVGKRFDRGLFYARIARDQAKAQSWKELLGISHNQLGNLLLGQNQVSEAAGEYNKALELFADATPTIRSGRCLDNLGYCRVLQGRVEEGLGLLIRSWRLLSSLRCAEAMVSLHLDLAFTYLEIDRHRYATRHGLKALALARELEDRESVKHALFLLGESCCLQGDEQRARDYYNELQAYYPELPVVTDLLLAVDARHLINLRG